MPPAASATEDLHELRWPRRVVRSAHLAPTSAAHPTTAHPDSSQQRRVRPGLPIHQRHGARAGSQSQSRTITPTRWRPRAPRGTHLAVAPGPEDALAEPTLAIRRRVEPPRDLDAAAFLARGNDHRD